MLVLFDRVLIERGKEVAKTCDDAHRVSRHWPHLRVWEDDWSRGVRAEALDCWDSVRVLAVDAFGDSDVRTRKRESQS